MKRFRRLRLCRKNSVSSRRGHYPETLVEYACVLRRKAEHLVLSGPFRRQVGEASDAHAMREPAINGGCSELASDNRLVGSSSPPSPTTQSPSNRDFPVLYEKPRFGGDSCAHFVSAGCRLDFRGRFGAFVSALQNRVSPRQRPVLVETWYFRFGQTTVFSVCTPALIPRRCAATASPSYSSPKGKV